MRIVTVATLCSSVFVLLPFAPFAAGCGVDPPTAIAAHRAGHGTGRIYDATLDEAWAAAHRALYWEKNGRSEDHFYDHPEEPFILVYHPGSPSPGTDEVGVWFLPEGPTRTLVKVVVMSGIETKAGIVGPDETSVQRDIAKALRQVQREEVAPDTETSDNVVSSTSTRY